MNDMNITIKNEVPFERINYDAEPAITVPEPEPETFIKDNIEYLVIEPDVTKYLHDGVYTLKIVIPRGGYIKQHQHQYAHTSILAQGRVDLIADGVLSHVRAPAVLSLKEGINHEILAQEDAVWFCIHQTDETDINKVDDSITLPTV